MGRPEPETAAQSGKDRLLARLRQGVGLSEVGHSGDKEQQVMGIMGGTQAIRVCD